MTTYLQRSYDFDTPEMASAYDEAFFWSARFGTILLDNVPLRPNANILDLACGTGFPTFELAHICGPSCRVTGVDIWTEALDRARTKLAFYDLPNVKLVEADGAQMLFGDSEFDLITSNLGINNFTDPTAVLAECYRVARPGATLALTTNLNGHMREFYQVFRDVLRDLGNPDYLARLDKNEHHRGTQQSVSDLLESSGFRVTRTVEHTLRFRYLNGTAFLNHHLTKVGFLEGWRTVVDPPDEAQLFTALETRLNELSSRSGELGLTVPALYIEAATRKT